MKRYIVITYIYISFSNILRNVTFEAPKNKKNTLKKFATFREMEPRA